MNESYLYKYKAKVISVYDGDTITVDIDLGMGVWLKDQKIRLYGLNSPEVRGTERLDGLRSRYYLSQMIEGKMIVLETIKDSKGKYGRYLGNVWFEGNCLNDLMVEKGYAQRKEY